MLIVDAGSTAQPDKYPPNPTEDGVGRKPNYSS